MGKIKRVIKRESSAIKKEFQEKTLGYIITALGLVAGLSWNDFIKSFIDSVFPIQNSADALWAKFLYALIITLAIVIISVYLLRLFAQNEDERNKSEKE